MWLLLCWLSLVFGMVNCNLKISTKVITMEVNQVANFEVKISNPPGDNTNKTLILITQYDDLMQIMPNNFEIDFHNKTNQTFEIRLYSFKAGNSGIFVITASVLPKILCIDKLFLNVKIHESNIIENLSNTLGWIYFLAWSFSFYPQIYSNYKRKSVVGLSFDFILFNLFGYLMYNSFNFGMYFVPVIKEQYILRHPRGVNPVYANDLFFSLHSLFATMLTLCQCAKYTTNNQSISLFAKIIIEIDISIAIIFMILAGLNIILWLDVLYVCSYIKLMVTITKYMPQVLLNFKRKSTQGWSIGGVILDFIGGLFSTFQIILDGYNYGDWTIILENPTKFGLGLISIVFDVIFLFQHFILYKIPVDKNDLNLQEITEKNKDKET